MTATRPASPTSQAALKGALIVSIGAVFVGFAPIGLRLSEMGPQSTAFWRFALSLPMLLAFASWRRLPLGRPSAPALAAGVFFGLDIAFWHAAVMNTSVANATFLVNIGSIATGLTAWLILKQRPRAIWPFAALLALSGAAAMSFGAGTNGAGALKGDLLALCAAMSLSFYFVSLAAARSKMGGLAVIVWATFMETLVAATAAFVMNEPLLPPSLAALTWPFFLALFAHCLGQGFIIYGAGMTPPAIAGVLVMLQPVVAGLIAWPVFSESLTLPQLVGGAAILFGVWLAGRK